MEIFNILTYDTEKETSILDIDDTYISVLELITPVREAGKYEVKLSLTYDFSSTNTSAYFRWRVDGGTWNEIITEPSDKNDRVPVYYEFPSDYLSGAHSIDIEARKENNTGTLNIHYLDASFVRVGL